jgi:hypothetical protein
VPSISYCKTNKKNKKIRNKGIGRVVRELEARMRWYGQIIRRESREPVENIME